MAKKELQRAMGERLARSAEKLDIRIREGDAYLPFTRGEPPTLLGGAGAVKEEEKAMGLGWRMTSYAAHAELRALLLPTLTGSMGAWENEQRALPPDLEGPAAFEAQEAMKIENRKRRMYEELARKIYKQFDIHSHKRMAIDDALTYRRGCFEIVKNANERLCGFQYVSSKLFMVDEETENDPLGVNQKWQARSYIMPESDAKWHAKKVWSAPNYKFQTLEKNMDAWWAINEQERPTRFVHIVYVYIRAGSPWLDFARDESGEDVGKDDVYKGPPKVLVMEAGGEGTNPAAWKLIAEMDYPYPLDHGDFPLTSFTLEPGSESFWGAAVYQKGHSLQVALNWALRYMNTDAWLSARRIIGVLKGALSKATLDEVLKNPENLLTVEFEDPAALERAWRILDFGQSNPALKEVFGAALGAYGQVTGRDVFSAMGKSHESATRAALSGERAQLILGSMIERVDAAMVEAMRKALMACRATMTAEDVARWIGEEYLYFGPGLPGERESPLWNDEINTPEEIRAEVEISLKARSTRFVNPEQQLADMDRFEAKIDAWVGKVLQANQINPALAAEFARMGNASIRAYGVLLGLPYIDDMTIDVTIAATQPMMPQMGGMGSEPAPEAGEGASPGAHALARIQEGLDLGPTAAGPLAEEMTRVAQ